jgi:REP element-mobilizing transposase RayT
MNTESSCEAAFARSGPYWHLYTNGEKMEVIFTGPSDFLFGITLLGICAAAFPRCRILTFALMSNHLHLVLVGSEQDVWAFFALFKERLTRYLSGQKRFCRMQNLEAGLFRIPDLRALRNEIIYVNRNGYVVTPDCTPFSYWWCAGMYFFNPMGWMLPSRTFASLTLRERRCMCHCRDADFPPHYMVLTNFIPGPGRAPEPMLLPTSFCSIREAEDYFRDAHQYFRRLGRDQEAFSEVARRLGERIYLTDEELFGAVCALCAKEFENPNPTLLSAGQKQEVARRMHFDYNASNKQIQRMLKLTASAVETLFPTPVCTFG